MNDPDSRSEPSREELIALVAAQAAEIAALKAHIAELERRLGLNGTNSGKPPSSDRLGCQKLPGSPLLNWQPDAAIGTSVGRTERP